MTQQRPWGKRVTTAAVGVAALIGVLGGGAVYAATESGGHGGGFGPGFGPGDFGPPPFAGQMHGGADHGSDVDPATLHGEFVVPDGRGGFQTDIVQRGTVTAVSPTSITARSDDGFTATYVIPPTAAHSAVPFAVNAKVSIRATRTGASQTVTTIGAP
ncbi:hypothetical protein SBI67_25635 [Mycolicibacterium sp. 120266]|jgi:hypothetical protein|uniref:hypothetical protein n=1 Tax=Mycolicibacterium sp. 120266 TaxID=3090601 RepID=UPI00299DB6D8|nr:hypothetical protein [Mycolicibacterium sp. 120266]MDX1875516.1 hypothetical protein [Mycolicibacterium sp. 120266]